MTKTRVGKPPPWFQLENYTVCKHFSTLQWVRALHVRRVIQERILGKHHFFDNIPFDGVGAAIKWCSIDVESSAIKPIPSDIGGFPASSVSIPQSTLELKNPNLIQVRVDITADDEILQYDLKKFVDEYRRSQNINYPRKFSNADAKKLTAHRVLPYLDLKLWNDYRDQWMTSEEYGDVLFPERIHLGSKGKVDETVKGWVERIYSNIDELKL